MADSFENDVLGLTTTKSPVPEGVDISASFQDPTAEESGDIVSMAFSDITGENSFLQPSTQVGLDSLAGVAAATTTTCNVNATVASDTVPHSSSLASTQQISSADITPISANPTQVSVSSGDMISAVAASSARSLNTTNSNTVTTAGSVKLVGANNSISQEAIQTILNIETVRNALRNNEQITIMQVPEEPNSGESRLIQKVFIKKRPRGRPPGRKSKPVEPLPSPTTMDDDPMEDDDNDDDQKGLEVKHKPSVTRYGRVSRPPTYRVRDYKVLRRADLAEEDAVDSPEDADYSDYSEEEDTRNNTSFDWSEPRPYLCDKCDKTYKGPGSLRRHYRSFPDHGDPDMVPDKPVSDSKRGWHIRNVANLSSARRVNRTREVLVQMGDDDAVEAAMPRLCGALSSWEMLLNKAEFGNPSRLCFPDIFREFEGVCRQMKELAAQCLLPAAQGGMSPVTMNIRHAATAAVLGLEPGHYSVQESPQPPPGLRLVSALAAKSAAKRAAAMAAAEEAPPPAKRAKVEGEEAGKGQGVWNGNGAKAAEEEGQPRPPPAEGDGSQAAPLGGGQGQGQLEAPPLPLPAKFDETEPKAAAAVEQQQPISMQVMTPTATTLVTKTSDGILIQKPEGVTLHIQGEMELNEETIAALVNMEVPTTGGENALLKFD